MTRRVILLMGALVLSTLALSVYVLRPSSDFQVVDGWMKLPEPYILGTPKGAPLPDEAAELWRDGNFPWGVTAFAGVAVDDDDRVYAFHRGQESLSERFPTDTQSKIHPIVIFDADGRFLRWAGDGIAEGLLGPHFIDVDPDNNLWVVERDGHRVMKLGSDLETVVMQFGVRGVPGDDIAHLDQPTDVAWSSNGDIFITDGYGNNRVLKFSKDGTFLDQWGGGPDSAGDGDGQFDLPHGVVVDWRDRVYVLDRENRRVQVFDTEGELLGKWTDIGYNWGIALPRDGGRAGFAYLANKGTETVAKVRLDDGVIVERFGGAGRAPGQLDGVHDLAVDSTGAVYVADTWGQRIQKFVEPN